MEGRDREVGVQLLGQGSKGLEGGERRRLGRGGASRCWDMGCGVLRWGGLRFAGENGRRSKGSQPRRVQNDDSLSQATDSRTSEKVSRVWGLGIVTALWMRCVPKGQG